MHEFINESVQAQERFIVEYNKQRDSVKTQLVTMLASSKADVFLLMKGVPEDPKCKFSRRIIEIMAEEGLSVNSYDILSDF